MKKAVGIMILAAIILTGCDDGYTEARAYGGEPFQFEKLDKVILGNGSSAYLYTDKETDVEYIVIETVNGTAICPRYHYDGSLYLR
jgi:hypothetical protein